MYTEPKETGNPFRAAYKDGLNEYLRARQKESVRRTAAAAGEILRDPDTWRARFLSMLGHPLTLPEQDAIPNVHATFVVSENGISLYRMVFDVLSVPLYGLLFVREDGVRRPLVIAQHGGLGTPELCSGLLGGSGNYNDMVQRALQYDVNVFAPQLMLWSADFSDDGTGDNRGELDQGLKQLGGSIAAFEIYAIRQSLNFLSRAPYTDPDRIGMLGLSYGGFYTLYTAAADTRIRCALCSAFFNDRIVYNWSDWVWKDSANLFPDANVALLVYPRRLWITVGRSDPLFDCARAEAEFARLHRVLPDDERVRFVAFDGTHEFPRDAAVLDEFMDALRADE